MQFAWQSSWLIRLKVRVMLFRACVVKSCAGFVRRLKCCEFVACRAVSRIKIQLREFTFGGVASRAWVGSVSQWIVLAGFVGGFGMPRIRHGHGHRTKIQLREFNFGW